MAEQPLKLSGACLCGAVAFEFEPNRSDIDACHCGQCRAWSGHYWASVNGPLAALRIIAGEDKLAWFRSSERVRRGFCKECGSALFWHPDRHAGRAHRIAVSAGSLRKPTRLKLSEHIFVGDKGDYYDIADGLPQKDAY